MWRKLRKSRRLQRLVGRLIAGYLSLVWRTNMVTVEPADIYDRADADMPFILSFWHGQHFLAGFFGRPHYRPHALVSRHGDGEINAAAVEALGIGAIRGSGGRGFHRKGAIGAVREMLAALADGSMVGLTADLPKVSRVAGLGTVTLASRSGRPIYPVAIATSRRIVINSWDRASLHLPFGRTVLVAAEPLWVAADVDDAVLEAARKLLQARLEWATARAEALVGRGADGR